MRAADVTPEEILGDGLGKSSKLWHEDARSELLWGKAFIAGAVLWFHSPVSRGIFDERTDRGFARRGQRDELVDGNCVTDRGRRISGALVLVAATMAQLSC